MTPTSNIHPISIYSTDIFIKMQPITHVSHVTTGKVTGVLMCAGAYMVRLYACPNSPLLTHMQTQTRDTGGVMKHILTHGHMHSHAPLGCLESRSRAAFHKGDKKIKSAQRGGHSRYRRWDSSPDWAGLTSVLIITRKPSEETISSVYDALTIFLMKACWVRSALQI